jgi:hypothetical protein
MRRRIELVAAAALAALVLAVPAVAGNGYVNMPERGCSPPFHEASADAFPGFELADLNQDGIVCAKQIPGRPGFDAVVDNTSNANP